jgi:hypothetical protein
MKLQNMNLQGRHITTRFLQGHAPHACRAPKMQHHVLSAQFASGETDHAYVRLVYRLTLGDRCGIVNGGYRGQEAVCVAEPLATRPHAVTFGHLEACTLIARQTGRALRLHEKQSDRLRPC